MSNVKFQIYEASQNQSSSIKKWAIGEDKRGVHTFFTEPGGSDLIYYHKPLLTDFNNNISESSKYVSKKISEKIRKGYGLVLTGFFNSKSRTFY